MSTLLVIGIKESANFNNIIVFVEGGQSCCCSSCGAAHAINPANWQPFMPPQAINDGLPVRGEFGWSGVMTGRGHRVLRVHRVRRGQHGTRRRRRTRNGTLPIGIIASLLICTVLYIIVSGIATGVMSYKDLNVPDPIAVVADRRRPRLDVLAHQAGRSRGLSSVDPGDVARAVAGVLDDVERRPRCRRSWRRSTPFPDALDITSILTGIGVAIVSAFLTVREAGSLVSIGDAAGLRDRVRSASWCCAVPRAEPAARLQDARVVRLVADPLGALSGPLLDGVVAVAHLGCG